MFTGRRNDPETGLYYYRARMYSPQLGRFLQTDPIGYADGMNQYQYCGSNPINWIDPWGLESKEGGGFWSTVFGFFKDEAIEEGVEAVAEKGGGLIPSPGQGDIDDCAVNAPGLLNETVPYGWDGVGKTNAQYAQRLAREKAAKEAAENASRRARRNIDLAGKRHPKTGIPFDKDGYPNFSGVSKKNVEIDFAKTGSDASRRRKDIKAANKAAGFDKTPDGYVWHHHQDGNTMQLVPEDIHIATGHDGGFAGN